MSRGLRTLSTNGASSRSYPTSPTSTTSSSDLRLSMVPATGPDSVCTLGCHPFNGFFSRTTWVSRYQKGKTSLDLNEARDYRVWDGSGISWTICKQPAPHFRQITTPTPHHSMFAGRMLFLTPNQQC